MLTLDLTILFIELVVSSWGGLQVLYQRIFSSGILKLFYLRMQISRKITLDMQMIFLSQTKKDKTQKIYLIKFCLPFLDVSLQRTSTSFITSIYRNLVFVGQYIPYNSFCPYSQKVNLISCLVFQAYKFCSKDKLNISSIFR